MQSILSNQTLVQITEPDYTANSSWTSQIKDQGFLSIEGSRLKFKYKPYRLSESNDTNSNALQFLSDSILKQTNGMGCMSILMEIMIKLDLIEIALLFSW